MLKRPIQRSDYIIGEFALKSKFLKKFRRKSVITMYMYNMLVLIRVLFICAERGKLCFSINLYLVGFFLTFFSDGLHNCLTNILIWSHKACHNRCVLILQKCVSKLLLWIIVAILDNDKIQIYVVLIEVWNQSVRGKTNMCSCWLITVNFLWW